MRPLRQTPYRTPEAVSAAMKDLIKGKVVCDLGCAEGDHLAFLSRYARKVIGVENDAARYIHAVNRGFEVVVGNYLSCELPDAEVYYAWPDDGPRDNRVLVTRLKEKQPCTLVLAADRGFPYEVQPVEKLAEDYGGRLMEVSFNEGPKPRQSGIFLLCVLELR